jgi:hypothetical protein
MERGKLCPWPPPWPLSDVLPMLTDAGPLQLVEGTEYKQVGGGAIARDACSAAGYSKSTVVAYCEWGYSILPPTALNSTQSDHLNASVV